MVLELTDISPAEDAEWKERYERIQRIFNSVHQELGELITEQLWDILMEYFSDNPSINYYYNTNEMTKDAMYIIVMILEDIVTDLKLDYLSS